MKTWQKIRQQPDILPRYLVRERVIDAIRLFFKQQGFHEVETPQLMDVPSAEPYLDVFETKLKLADGGERRAFLTTSPEYALKKLLTAGLGNIFQVCKAFRNGEGLSERHNPEFTILEWYRAEADYTVMMQDFEALFLAIGVAVNPQRMEDLSHWHYQGEAYDVTPPWPRIAVADAFHAHAGIDTETLLDEKRLVVAAQQKGYRTTPETTWEEVYNQIFLNEIEPKLNALHKPVFMYDYPVSQAALSRKKVSDPRFAERFEVFLAGLELGNAFSELADAAEQEARLRVDLGERKRLGKTEYAMDNDFIAALKTGMPQAAGISVGVDRLVVLFADVGSVADTLFFPVAEVFDLR